MTIQHADIPSAKCHEAKQIIDAGTADAGKVITPSAVTPGLGVLRSLTTPEVLYQSSLQTSLATQTINVETVGMPVLALGPNATQVVTVTLGAAASAKIRRVQVIYAGATGGEIRVQAPAGTINGNSYIYLRRTHETAEFITDGTSWWMVATNVIPAGFQWVRDSQYTSGVPLSVAASTRTRLTIDNLLAGQESYKDSRYDFWDQATNSIKFTKPGDVMALRIAIRAKMAATSGYFDLESSFPSPITGTNVTTEVMAKGGGVENRFIREYSFFLDDYAMTQGALELWVTPSVNMDFWGLTLMVSVQSSSYLGGHE